MKNNISQYAKMTTFKKNNINNLLSICYSNFEDKKIFIITDENLGRDFLGNNFADVATLIYKKTFMKSGVHPDFISWMQYYPGNKGFIDSFEWVNLDWDDIKNKYKIFYREPIKHEISQSIINSIKPI